MDAFKTEREKRGLLVFVPGLPSARRRGSRAPHDDLLERLRSDLGPTWRLEVFRHGQTATSRADLDAIVDDLAAHLRDWSGELSVDVERPEEIILVGHSFGGVLARAAYLRDVGGRDGAPRPWTAIVRRIVLLGSPNAGFRWNAKGTPLAWRLAYALATPFADYAVERVEAGGYWITDLRLRWLDAFRRLEDRPTVVQVLGTSDDLVTREDILDSRYMPDTVEVMVPGATHAGLVDLSTAADPERRFQQLQSAILGRPDEASGAPAGRSTSPTFFVLHGIRASAYEHWVQDLSSYIQTMTGTGEVRFVRPDTGFFSALEFALPGSRNRKVHQFLKLYGDAYATGDPDRFTFAGHSNGTYMMARAMSRVPAMRFRRIYLAGTVLPRDFDWQGLVDRRQIGSYGSAWRPGAVRNDRSTRDVPVGILCSWLRGLGSSDVGTAGVTGFEHAPSILDDGARAYAGGHGAALRDPARLQAVAGYLTETATTVPPPGGAGSIFRWFSRFVGTPVVAWLLLLALVGALTVAFVALGGAIGPGPAAALGAAIVLALVVLLRTI